jgi:hypothetical protein
VCIGGSKFLALPRAAPSHRVSGGSENWSGGDIEIWPPLIELKQAQGTGRVQI